MITQPSLLPNHMSCQWMAPNDANKNEGEERREEKCASQGKCISSREGQRLVNMHHGCSESPGSPCL